MRGQGGKGRENVACMENIPLGKRLAALVKHGAFASMGQTLVWERLAATFTIVDGQKTTDKP